MQATTINMAQALLDRGKELWEQDRYEAASGVLSRLLSLRMISPEIAERAQFYLGDIQLAQGQYSKARRHLSAAIGSGTATGETHFLMACALEWDDESDPVHAYRHYRRAVELEPGQPLYSSAYALMRIRRKPDGSKFDREALRRLRAAFAAAPDDPDVVYNYAFGLVQMGRDREAEIAIRRARKRWHDHPAFEGLWFDFLSGRGVLPRALQPNDRTPQLRLVSDDEPVILKFPVSATAPPPPRALRPRARLKTALASLDEKQVRDLSLKLELLENGDEQFLRDQIDRTLRNPQYLRSMFGRLSVGSRHLIQVLTNAGGSADVKELRLRVDAASKLAGPHWSKRRMPPSPLDELRQHGLVYLTTQSSEQDTTDVVMIPSDLRKLLREVLLTAQ